MVFVIADGNSGLYPNNISWVVCLVEVLGVCLVEVKLKVIQFVLNFS